MYDCNKLKWVGDLGSLKQITSDVFGLERKWTSPGGQAKRFTSSNTDLIFTWYPGKQTNVCCVVRKSFVRVNPEGRLRYRVRAMQINKSTAWKWIFKLLQYPIIYCLTK